MGPEKLTLDLYTLFSFYFLPVKGKTQHLTDVTDMKYQSLISSCSNRYLICQHIVCSCLTFLMARTAAPLIRTPPPPIYEWNIWYKYIWNKWKAETAWIICAYCVTKRGLITSAMLVISKMIGLILIQGKTGANLLSWGVKRKRNIPTWVMLLWG